MLSASETPVRANLYFVLPSECKDVDEIDEEMKMAFQESEEAGLAPQWITEAKCMKKAGVKNDIFVLRKFEGELFNKLCTFKSGRVVGPRCLRTCVLEGLPVPDTRSPVFTTAMRNLIITATQIPAERKVEIKKMVGYMGGHYTNNLVESVTHLVTNVVRSAKYEKASEQGIPVMVEAWINAVWEASLVRNVRATDPEFEKYKCPVFLDMYITCSNLTRAEKEHMKELITKHGGIFTPHLRQQETCLVVIKEPRGEKYKSAQAWGLPCVYPSWVLESVDKGYAVPSAKHLLSPQLKCSTPTKGETPSFTCSTDASVSIIPFDIDNKTQVNESALSNATVTQQMTQLSQPRSVRAQKRDKEYKQVLSSIIIAQAKRAGPFLDGYKIFLSGFTSMETEKLRRILSLGGATVFSSLTESVTHVIVGDFVPADAKTISSSGLRPHVVKLDWLAASIKQKGAADEEQYTYPDFGKTAPEPPSPLSQKVLRMLQPQHEEKQQADETKTHTNNDAATAVPRKLFKDFVNEANQDDSANQKDPGPLVSVNQNLSLPEPPANDYSSQSQSQSLNCSEIFKGLLFLLIDLDQETEENMQSLITTCGGTMVARSFKGIADYAIVPFDGTSVNITATEIITELWVPYSELRKRVYAKFLGVKYDDFDVDPVTGDVKDSGVGDSEGASSQSVKNRSSYLHKIAKDMSSASDADTSECGSSKSHNTSPGTSEKSTSEVENEKQIASNMISSRLDRLQERLSSHSTPERVLVPQRSMVPKQPVENTSGPSNNKIASGLLPDSQPIAIGWEDPTESAEKAKMMGSSPSSVSEESQTQCRKFVLSNVEEREKYESLLKSLGETVITSSFYDPETTHLILDKPIRSEKLLCCLAAGKWILNTNYLIESEKQKKLLPEEDYEWGNPRSKANIPQYEPGTTEYQLACAVYRWRTKLKPGEGAFKGMKVVLILSNSRIESFVRLIAAGSGEVLPTSSILEATHCFVDYAKVSLPVELSLLVKHRVPCLPPIYVGEFLIKDPPPQPQDALIPEYKRLLKQE